MWQLWLWLDLRLNLTFTIKRTNRFFVVADSSNKKIKNESAMSILNQKIKKSVYSKVISRMLMLSFMTSFFLPKIAYSAPGVSYQLKGPTLIATAQNNENKDYHGHIKFSVDHSDGNGGLQNWNSLDIPFYVRAHFNGTVMISALPFAATGLNVTSFDVRWD